jgi:hypothetical protein
MDRRMLLAAAGSGLAALAGCGADSESETGVPTGEDNPDGTWLLFEASGPSASALTRR